MPTIPTGAPAWVRNVDHTVYGGDVNKTNWQSQGVTNSRTDVGAEAFCRLTADLAAVVRTAPFFEIRVLCDDTTPANPTVQYVRMMTGQRASTYAGGSPPAGFPFVARVSNGLFGVRFDGPYLDPYGVVGVFDLQHAVVQLHGASAQCASHILIDNNADGFFDTVLVSVFNVPGGAAAVSPLVTIIGA